jgi:hypothetical protein
MKCTMSHLIWYIPLNQIVYKLLTVQKRTPRISAPQDIRVAPAKVYWIEVPPLYLYFCVPFLVF